MDEDKKLAIQLAMGFIQNSNVKPSGVLHTKEEHQITYKITDGEYTFCELVRHFLYNIEELKKLNFRA